MDPGEMLQAIVPTQPNVPSTPSSSRLVRRRTSSTYVHPGLNPEVDPQPRSREGSLTSLRDEERGTRSRTGSTIDRGPRSRESSEVEEKSLSPSSSDEQSFSFPATPGGSLGWLPWTTNQNGSPTSRGGSGTRRIRALQAGKNEFVGPQSSVPMSPSPSRPLTGKMGRRNTLICLDDPSAYGGASSREIDGNYGTDSEKSSPRESTRSVDYSGEENFGNASANRAGDNPFATGAHTPFRPKQKLKRTSTMQEKSVVSPIQKLNSKPSFGATRRRNIRRGRRETEPIPRIVIDPIQTNARYSPQNQDGQSHSPFECSAQLSPRSDSRPDYGRRPRSGWQGGSSQRPLGSSSRPSSLQQRPSSYCESLMFQIDNIKVGLEIGKGSFGSVYQAVDMVSGVQYAMKRIFNTSSEGHFGEIAPKVEEEIKVMRHLGQHPNIVEYFDSQVNERGEIDIYMEYVPGGSISTLVKTYGGLSETLAARYTRQILKGVKFLHDHEIIHRDIKGANVLVTTQGVAKLADFGTAKNLGEMGTIEKEGTLKTIRGSVPWMAPEMVRETGVNFKTDIWSVGATVLEMTSGKRPWSEISESFAIIFRLGKQEEKPVIHSDASDVLRNFIDRCFAFDVETRPTADQLLDSEFANFST